MEIIKKGEVWYILSRLGFTDWENKSGVLYFRNKYKKTIRIPADLKRISEEQLKEMFKEANVNYNRFRKLYLLLRRDKTSVSRSIGEHLSQNFRRYYFFTAVIAFLRKSGLSA
ncbi:MAG TPA: hypothetical protein VJC03_08130 [bacterium]|nr:hypothetical protein [bacterium]